MAEVVLFHHAQGLTSGVVAFADELRRAGHTVHTPDLFDGHTFGSIEEGMGYAGQIGFPGEVIARGLRAVEALPDELVYVGFSLGVVLAQMLAQTRPGTADLTLSDPRHWPTPPGRTARPPAKPPAISTSPFTISGLTS
jgi:esterase/lipase